VSDLQKKYRAYLTRRGKYEAIRICNRQQVVTVEGLRVAMLDAKELAEYVDEKWARKTLSDKKLFEPSEGAGYRMVSGTKLPDKAPEWSGLRPGEDPLRDTFDKAVAKVLALPNEPPWDSYRLAHGDWVHVSKIIVGAMNHLKKRGVERPLGELQSMAFSAALATDDRATQTVALWLIDTAYYVDAYGRLQKGEIPPEGAGYFSPSVIEHEKGEDGKLVPKEEADPVKRSLKTVRGILTRRGILKRRAA
jgi:hypothetical protein